MSTMKRELELRSDSYEDPLLLLNSATLALRSSEISKGDLGTMLLQCESLRTAILAKLASHAT